MENKEISESDEFGLIFDEFKALLDKRDYEGANTLMKEYLNDENIHVDVLKTILVITKSFKTNPVMCDTRKKVLELCETKLGQKLI
jgi:hypothetical protein